MAFVAPTCLLLGILIAPWIDRFQHIVPFVFAFMTFQSSLGSGFKDVSGAFRRPLPLLVAFAFLHGVLPAIAYAAGRLLFGASPEIVTGMVLEFTIPTGIVTLIWVSIASGNAALSLSLVFLDTVLAPFVVPAVLYLFGGPEIHIDAGMVTRMMRGLAFMVAIPAFLAVALNQLTRGRVKTTLMPKLSLLTKLGFVVVITLNSTGLHEYVVVHPSWLIAGVAATMGALAVAGFFAGALAGRAIRADAPTASSLILGIGMRNIAAGATLAAAYFPGQAVILPVMLATLFQQVLAATVGMGLIGRLRR
jgi:BASS family bile acid:Na+ symporter